MSLHAPHTYKVVVYLFIFLLGYFICWVILFVGLFYLLGYFIFWVILFVRLFCASRQDACHKGMLFHLNIFLQAHSSSSIKKESQLHRSCTGAIKLGQV